MSLLGLSAPASVRSTGVSAFTAVSGTGAALSGFPDEEFPPQENEVKRTEISNHLRMPWHIALFARRVGAWSLSTKIVFPRSPSQWAQVAADAVTVTASPGATWLAMVTSQGTEPPHTVAVNVPSAATLAVMPVGTSALGPVAISVA